MSDPANNIVLRPVSQYCQTVKGKKKTIVIDTDIAVNMYY